MSNRSQASITLYTLPYCPDCRDLRRHLDRQGLVYEEINVAHMPGAVYQMLEANGGRRSAPTIRIGEHVLVDPDISTVDRVLIETGLVALPPLT